MKKYLRLLFLLLSFITIGYEAKPQCTFTNPIVTGNFPDPWVMFKDGYYYWCKQDYGCDLTVERFKGLPGTVPGEGWTKVFSCGGGGIYSDVWAPELHFLDGKWYIYASGDTDPAPGIQNLRIFVLESVNWNGPYTNIGIINTADFRSEWCIDPDILMHPNGKKFMTWSQWEGGMQCIYIGEMSTHNHIINAVKLSQPTFDWERNPNDLVNEGPEFLIKNNKIHIAYSGSQCHTSYYSLGLLTADLNSNLTDPVSWSKSASSVFSSGNNIWGPGHNCFVKSPDQTEDWIIYHAHVADRQTVQEWGDRSMYAQKFTWNGDYPVFGPPIARGQSQVCVSTAGTLSPIVNGHTYTIKAKNSGKVCGVTGSGINNTDKVVQQTYADNASQKWVAFDLGAGNWKFINVKSVKSLEIELSSLADGGAAEQYTFSNTSWQSWKIEPASAGYFKITNSGSGKVLDVSGGPSAIQDGIKIQQWTWLSADNQQWSFNEVLPVTEGKNYVITARHSGKAIQVYNSGKNSGDKIGQFTVNGSVSQSWTAHNITGNMAYFDNVNSGKALEVGGNSAKLGGIIQQWDYVGNNWQQWSIIGTDEGYFQFLNHGVNMVMDVSGGITALANGDSIHQWTYVGADNQKWKITEAVAGLVTGINEKNSDQVSIYPNPAKDFITITSTETISYVIITDVLGRIFYKSDEVFIGSKTISTNGLPENIYFIMIKEGDNLIVKKILIK
jgi:GH43 family beta-xylosidase